MVFVTLSAAHVYPASERRVALVIGNSEYQHTAALRNPKNDADAVSSKLESLGFDVVRGIDLDQDGMQRTIGEFSTKLSQADVGLFFYAGHGLQVAGENYLLPIDGKLSTELDLQFKAVKLNLILRIMEGQNRTSIVLLDACRDNPLAEELSRSLGGTRGGSIGRGLARVETGVGTYIGFSTQPGNVALDGDGENSPFASALVKRIDTPGLDIESLMRRVRQDVRDETRGTQTPWGNSSLIGRGFVFKEEQEEVEQASLNQKGSIGSNGSSALTTENNSQVEIAFWDAIKDSSDPNFLQAYMDRYPNGLFFAIARLKLDSLKKNSNTTSETRGTTNTSDNSADIAYWDFVKDKTNVAYFESYVTRYPDGIFVDIAKLKIGELGGTTPKTEPVEKPKANDDAKKLADKKAQELAAEKARKLAAKEAQEKAKILEQQKTAAAQQQSTAAARQAQQNRQLTEISYWNSILNQTDPELFRAYLVRYPDGIFASIAKFKIGPQVKDSAKSNNSTGKAGISESAEKEVKKAENQEIDQKEIKLAKLEEQKTDPEPEVVVPKISKRDLAKGVQRELNRVGCDAGKVDGFWGKGSIRALKRFEKHLNVSLDSDQPSGELFEQLQNIETRICPLNCGVKQVESNGQCIAKTCASGERLNSRGACVAKPKVAEPKKSKPAKQKQASKPKAEPAAQPKRKTAPKSTAKRQPSGCGTCILDPADNTVSERVCGRKYIEAKGRGWCGRSVRSKTKAKKRRTTRRKSANKTSSNRQCGRCVVDPADNTVAERLCGRRYIDAKGRGWCN